MITAWLTFVVVVVVYFILSRLLYLAYLTNLAYHARRIQAWGP